MELELTRVELLQTGLTGGRTMRLLPGPGGKNQQRVAVGDDDGVVQVALGHALGLQIYLKERNGHIAHDTYLVRSLLQLNSSMCCRCSS